MAKKRTAPQAQPFLEDIRAHPDDDAPRLVYADWLTDHGQPERGELIGVQCRLAGMSEDDPGWAELKDREWELLTLHRSMWREDLPAWARKAPYEIRRGFVSSISLTATQFLRQGDGLFRAVPIQELQLRNLRRELAQVVLSPLLARLTSLDVRENDLTSGRLRDLLSSSHLTGLRELNLHRNGIGFEGMRVLAAWAGLALIESLDLSGVGGGADYVKALAASPHLASLRKFNWSRNILALSGSETLGEAPGFARLTHLWLVDCEVRANVLRAVVPALSRLADLRFLDLSGNRFGSEGTPALAGALGRLTTLIARDNYLGPLAAAELARSASLGSLRHLDLAENHLGSEGAAALAEARFGSLKSLRLDANGIGSAGIEALMQSPHLVSLEALMLYGNDIGDQGAIAIASSPSMSNLRSLRLGHNYIGPRGAAALADSPNLSGLHTLALGHNPLGEEGVRALAESPYLSNLRLLDLSECGGNEKAALALASSGNLPQLRKLELRGNSIGVVGYRALALSPALPRLIVLSLNHGDPDSELVQRDLPPDQAATP
jgi:uncharacterized protein (TIGR02996 family)